MIHYSGGLTLSGHEPAGNVRLAWLPLVLLPLAALLVRGVWPAWVFMWVMAVAVYSGCKWLTYCEAVRVGIHATPLRSAGYLLGWAGMDAPRFLQRNATVKEPTVVEWSLAVGKTTLGVALVWFGARAAERIDPLLAGWIGMIGVIFLLHFGSFHAQSLAWRLAGVDAVPLMRNPGGARSLAEFWGRRWNTAFHEVVHRFTFRPMTRRVGAAGATLVVFAVSGLAHELVISLPAGGGYGLPTGYFVIQGVGVLCEHSRLGRKLGLGREWRGWLFTMVVTAAPAFWLFHPTFVRNVILPMLRAIGAL